MQQTGLPGFGDDMCECEVPCWVPGLECHWLQLVAASVLCCRNPFGGGVSPKPDVFAQVTPLRPDAGCAGLQSTDLRHCKQVSDSGLRPSRAGFPGLQNINVASVDVASRQQVSDEDLPALSAGLPGMRRIDLQGCQLVSDAGQRALGAGCTGLQRIDLRHC